MKLGVISDIHSNKVALDAVLEDMPSVDRLVCCGDIVGYGPWPAKCVDTVRDECDVIVRGNHDREMQNPEEYRQNHMAYQGLIHSAQQLSEEQYEWVTSLPLEDVAAEKYRVVHSHPAVEDMYVRPEDFQRMGKYMDDFEGLFLGHTHVQHAEYVEGQLVLNPGSVGQPRDDNTDAAYAVVDTDDNTVQLNRVEYDIQTVMDAVQEQGLPEKTAIRLKSGW